MEILSPYRNLLVVVVCYQLHSFRFMFSAPLREAWGSIDASIRSLTGHPRCPAAVASAYGTVARTLRSLVKSKDELMAEAQARASGGSAGGAAGGIAGALQKCSVM